jgi:hypothetical protein
MQETLLAADREPLLHAVGPFGRSVMKRFREGWPGSVVHETADLSFPFTESDLSDGRRLVVAIVTELPSAQIALDYTSALVTRGMDLVVLVKDDERMLLGPLMSAQDCSCCWACAVRRLQQHHLAERDAETARNLPLPSRTASVAADLDDLAAAWLNWAFQQQDGLLRERLLILNTRPFWIANESPIGFDGCPICDRRVDATGRTTSTLLSELQWLWRENSGGANEAPMDEGKFLGAALKVGST